MNWPLYTAKLDVCSALFPERPRNPGETVSQTMLLMTIGSDDMMSTETIPMRLSMILHLLPLLPGSEFTPTDIGTAIDHLDKLRMNEELDRCYDALEQNLEYYHPVNPVHPGLECCYRTVAADERRHTAAAGRRIPARQPPQHRLPGPLASSTTSSSVSTASTAWISARSTIWTNDYRKITRT